MKLLSLPNECNTMTIGLLKKVYSSADYYDYVNRLYKCFDYRPANLTNDISNRLIGLLNIILIDNVTKIIVNKDPISLVAAIGNKTLPLTLDIGYRHYKQLIGDDTIENEDALLNQTLVINSLLEIMIDIYTKNTDEFNQAVMQMFDVLYLSLGLLDIKWYSGTLIGNGNPGLLISENIDETNNAY